MRARDIRAKAKNSRGFTLVEVLIALIIFALVGTVLQQVTASSVSQLNTVRYKMLASWIAQNKLAELRLGSDLPAAKETKESLTYAGLEWQLLTVVKKTENPDINEVRVDVIQLDPEADSDEGHKRISLGGYVGRY